MLTDDAFFSTGTRLKRVGVVGPEPGLLWTDAEGSGSSGRIWTNVGLV